MHSLYNLMKNMDGCYNKDIVLNINYLFKSENLLIRKNTQYELEKNLIKSLYYKPNILIYKKLLDFYSFDFNNPNNVILLYNNMIKYN